MQNTLKRLKEMIAKFVLIIDDDPSILYIAKLGFQKRLGPQKLGWSVLTANSGQEGLAIAESQQPDVILLDMMMPKMDGLSTLKQIKANPKTQHIPVIFLTAKAQSTDRNHFCNEGAHGLIPKPFDPTLLPEQVEGLLLSAQGR
jgi:CheY-like chemotaxis protein